MRRKLYTKLLYILFGSAITTTISSAILEAAKPNIVIIYTDDIGYGDISCYGATRVSTPNIDQLAKNGIRFTDGHAASATCTPSRFAMLTGQYAWRQKGTGIARGDAAMIIKPGTPTLATVMKNAGYTTGVVGKWHLGLGNGNVDWNKDISPGPLEIGFDYAFLMPATGDRVPCVYFENHRVLNLDPNDPITVSFGRPIGAEPTGKANPELLKMHPSHGHNQTIINGISRIGYMSGGKKARWIDEDIADRFTEKAVAFIDSNKDQPFFLFFSTHDIHVPRTPHARFVGKTEMGPRGDTIVETDWCVGQIMNTLAKHDLIDNTLVIFTSDNGPVVDDGYKDDAVEKLGDHTPSGPFRGGKYSAFEAGTRVPFIVNWPGTVQPGESDALVCQIDFMASFAALTDQELSESAGPDSENVIDALLGKSDEGRDSLVEHARTLALRHGKWKYIAPKKGPPINRNTNTEVALSQRPQLYNLAADIGEKLNLASSHREKLAEMQALLEKIKASGGAAE